MSQSEFVRRAINRKIKKKSALMEHAALTRGHAVERVSVNTILVWLAGRLLAFQDMNGPSSSAAAKYACANKMAARRLLRSRGLVTVRSRDFPTDDLEGGWRFAASLGGAVVVKPGSQAMSRGITTGVTGREQFAAAWQHAAAFYEAPHVSPTLAEDHAQPSIVIVEEEVSGEDFRAFVVGDRVVSVTQRRRASVEGDGRQTIGELIEEKNLARAANPGLADYPIPTDPALLDRLATSGLELDDVPPAGEVVTLRSLANLSAGGDSVDVTDEAHPGFNDIALRALEAVPGLRYAGVDIIAPSITDAPTPDNHVIGEVEFSPGPMGHFPAVGQPRDMAGSVLELYADDPDAVAWWS